MLTAGRNVQTHPQSSRIQIFVGLNIQNFVNLNIHNMI